nr:BTB/POZ and MATH domain-containing protein 1-like [Aegilops tauschii subsp. strangulata]
MIGVFIRPSIDGDDIKVEATVTLKPVDPTGELAPFPPHSFTHVYVGRNCDGWGWGNFISAKSANSHYVGHDGSFTIQCQVKVHTESCTSSTMGVGTIIVVPPSNFAWHLEQLLVMEEGSDVKFLVEDSEIRAHGLVIATRSPVLHEAVESASGTDHVRIDGIRAMAFKAMLHFIYTDELPHVDDLVPADGDSTMMAGEMLAAACRFRLERMKRLCINLLAENVVTVLSALATVKVARRHNCPELEEYCRQYMSLPNVANKVTETCINLFLESQLA